MVAAHDFQLSALPIMGRAEASSRSCGNLHFQPFWPIVGAMLICFLLEPPIL